MNSSNNNKNKNKEKSEEQPDKTEDKPQAEEVEKVKKARKVAPKFAPEMFNDPQKGLSYLFKKVDKLEKNIIKGDKESLAILMRIYQEWIFKLFPADFGDMCTKMNSLPSVKKIVRSFVFAKKGFSDSISDRLLDNFIEDEDESKDNENYNENKDNENYNENIQQKQPLHFLDDNDDDIDISDSHDTTAVVNTSNNASEILDFIGEEPQ